MSTTTTFSRLNFTITVIVKVIIHLFTNDISLAFDVTDKTLMYKSYNYVSNLLYIFEKKECIIIERMNIFFIIDSKSQIHMFDLEKCLSQQPKQQKTEVIILSHLITAYRKMNNTLLIISNQR